MREKMELLRRSPVSYMSLDLTLQYARRLLQEIRCSVTSLPQPGAIHL
jgi:hypothetical protein